MLVLVSLVETHQRSCSFFSMIDAKLLEAYVSELKSKPATRRQYLPAFHDLLAMHASVLRLLQACALHDVSTAALLLQDKQALRRLLLLLGVSHEGEAAAACALDMGRGM